MSFHHTFKLILYQYAEYWRHKLRNNRKIEFPKEMSARVADVTADFSFAYMKEAFVAALLVIVARTDETQTFRYREDNLTENILWKELKKQIDSLRKEMEGEDDDQSLGMSGMWPALSSVLESPERVERPVRSLFGYPQAQVQPAFPQPGMERSPFREPTGQRNQFPLYGAERNARPMDIHRAMPRYF